jgi:hypothetical protein
MSIRLIPFIIVCNRWAHGSMAFLDWREYTAVRGRFVLIVVEFETSV